MSIRPLHRLAFVLVLCAAAAPAPAATRTVTSLDDTGAGTLRDALAGAQAGDEIVFAPALAGSIVLANTLTVPVPLSIHGSGSVALDGNDAVRVLSIPTGARVLLDGLVIRRGFAADGGGILSAGELVLVDCIVERNHASDRGGGLFQAAAPGSRYTIVDSTFADNGAVAEGGAIVDFSTAASAIDSSRITGNVTAGSGGGIRHVSGQALTIRNSTIAGNQSTGTSSTTGGGIASQSSPLAIIASRVLNNKATFAGGVYVANLGTPASLQVVNSVIAGNTATSDGGGVFVFGATATITSTTIANNAAVAATSGGIGVQNSGAGTASLALLHATVASNRSAAGAGGVTLISGTLSLRNTIVANNAAPANPDVLGAFTSLGYNLVQTRGTSTGYVATDLANGANPSLAPLQFAGGATEVAPPGAASAARNAVAAASCVLARDQRDYLRPAGACDIGAMDVDAASTPDALFQGGFE